MQWHDKERTSVLFKVGIFASLGLGFLGLLIITLSTVPQMLISNNHVRSAAAEIAVIKADYVSKQKALAKAEAEKKARHSNPASPLILVNKKHPLEPVTFTPEALKNVYGATLAPEASDHFARMFEAAAAAGVPFQVTSSYRSYDTQVVTYEYWLQSSGKDEAEAYSAHPGHSEHQTGFVVDLQAGGCALHCFGATPQYQWLQDNAAEYGFIQRYYAGSEAITGYGAEEWHYRYIGVDEAKAMKAKGVKTLEHYWGFEGGNYASDNQ